MSSVFGCLFDTTAVSSFELYCWRSLNIIQENPALWFPLQEELISKLVLLVVGDSALFPTPEIVIRVAENLIPLSSKSSLIEIRNRCRRSSAP